MEWRAKFTYGKGILGVVDWIPSGKWNTRTMSLFSVIRGMSGESVHWITFDNDIKE
jgi:hypothetical protein